jgi:hypothetical protein
MEGHDFQFEWDQEVTEDVINELTGYLEAEKIYNKAKGNDRFMDVKYTTFSTGDGIMYNIGLFLDKVVTDGISANEQTVRLWAYNADHPDKAVALLTGVLKKLDLYKPIRKETEG